MKKIFPIIGLIGFTLIILSFLYGLFLVQKFFLNNSDYGSLAFFDGFILFSVGVIGYELTKDGGAK